MPSGRRRFARMGIVTMGIFLLLAGWWFLLGGRVLPGERFPALSLPTLDGELVALAEQVGNRPAVVNLWATWCEPCRREMPVLREVEAMNPDVAFLYVNHGEDLASIAAFLDAERLSGDGIYSDPAGQFASETESRMLPATLFYDGNGRRVARHLGELTARELAGYLDALR